MDSDTDIDFLKRSHDTRSETVSSRRLADLQVLPLLVLGFATYQLDRTNISSALTGGFSDDIHVDQNTINLGNQLMFLGVIVLEIPSNMLLPIFGPRRWIGSQVLVFGIIAALQVFVRDRTGFLVTRAVLGLAEAGYIPAAMYTLSTWYSKEQITTRIAVFFFGMFGGTAVSPLLGAALLRLDGRGGLAGWQWLFLVEGVWSMVVAVLLLLHNPPANHTSTTTIPLTTVWNTLTNTHKWAHFLATACVFATWSPLTTYTPSIIMSLGFPRSQSNALAAVGSFLTLPVILFFAWLSDKTKQRGVVVMLAMACYLVALVVLKALLHAPIGKWGMFALWTTVNGLAVGYHPIHNAWIQMNCRCRAERSVSVAMFVMTATGGLMAGTQIFRGDEASTLYPRGVLIMIALVLVGLVLTGVQVLVYMLSNRRSMKRSTGKMYIL
ncbi:MFS general substrate transporter [Aspergillus campestris IBT 28561]|uniref:MFS general substrate transporter n=1 Tax=Aspergillus campestris (strain IBT 28561) TaxID=1392248 RepID=A0A2I1CWL6_ASPC2|nr:MFS general substrate transporter [Aspergillus campestris IBT 28561]PKY02021.1 MFS general substrate transporter [Aspergillus campestris IBT 28561]